MKTPFPLPRRTLLLAAAAALAGCGTNKPPATAADQRAAAPSALSTERQWLQSWFQGTPVRIEQLRDGPVTIEVPREFCFDAGRSEIKPALSALLDKTAESLRRLPLARVSLLAAPDDSGGAAPLALQRATQVQRRLMSRGVAFERLPKPAGTQVAAVQLRIEAAAAP